MKYLITKSEIELLDLSYFFEKMSNKKINEIFSFVGYTFSRKNNENDSGEALLLQADFLEELRCYFASFEHKIKSHYNASFSLDRKIKKESLSFLENFHFIYSEVDDNINAKLHNSMKEFFNVIKKLVFIRNVLNDPFIVKYIFTEEDIIDIQNNPVNKNWDKFFNEDSFFFEHLKDALNEREIYLLSEDTMENYDIRNEFQAISSFLQYSKDYINNNKEDVFCSSKTALNNIIDLFCNFLINNELSNVNSEFNNVVLVNNSIIKEMTGHLLGIIGIYCRQSLSNNISSDRILDKIHRFKGFIENDTKIKKDLSIKIADEEMLNIESTDLIFQSVYSTPEQGVYITEDSDSYVSTATNSPW